jgi:hypothetical protein
VKGVLACHAKGAKRDGVVDGACLEKRFASFSDPKRGCYVLGARVIDERDVNNCYHLEVQ